MRTRMLLAAAFAVSAPAAQAEDAIRDISGHLFCSNDDAGVDLRETGDGGYKVDIVVSSRGDIAGTVYPGGVTLFGNQGELVPYVSTNYEFFLDSAGNPTGRPAPVRLSVSTGRFAGVPPRPLQSLTLQLGAGDFKSAPIGIEDSAFNNIAIVSGDLAPTGSENPYDSEWPRDQFEDLVDHFEQSSARWIILSQNGGEVARIPVPQQDLQAVREKAIAYVQKTTPLLKKGKCG